VGRTGKCARLISVTAVPSPPVHWDNTRTCNKLYKNISKCTWASENNANKQK